ncbi:MAG: hypothetical protein IJR95_07650 [Lachnospiraceae bacterium]|nr:hypothetical protein [Lachnospiraceae bacterium]
MNQNENLEEPVESSEKEWDTSCKTEPKGARSKKVWVIGSVAAVLIVVAGILAVKLFKPAPKTYYLYAGGAQAQVAGSDGSDPSYEKVGEYIELTESEYQKYSPLIVLPEEYFGQSLRNDYPQMSDEEFKDFAKPSSIKQERSAAAGQHLMEAVCSFDSTGRMVYRKEYGGSYLIGDRFVVLIPREVPGAETYLKQLIPAEYADVVDYKTVDKSVKDLTVFKDDVFFPAIQGAGLRMYMLSVNEWTNQLYVAVNIQDFKACCELILQNKWENLVRVEVAMGEPRLD